MIRSRLLRQNSAAASSAAEFLRPGLPQMEFLEADSDFPSNHFSIRRSPANTYVSAQFKNLSSGPNIAVSEIGTRPAMRSYEVQ